MKYAILSKKTIQNMVKTLSPL